MSGDTLPGLASVFISYGSPDEKFAQRLNTSLREKGVYTYLFMNDARPGEKLHREMRVSINQYDRVLLVCSRNSLDRPGVTNEIEETLQREAREGGSSRLIPIMLDDYVRSNWAPRHSDVALSIRDRVIADFRDAAEDDVAFEIAIERLFSSLVQRDEKVRSTESTPEAPNGN